MGEKLHQPIGRTYVAMLKACAKSKDMERASQIHTELLNNGLLRSNLFVGSTLIDLYVKCGSLAKAQDVFDKLTVRNVVTWNAVIGGYVHHNCAKKALDYFKHMCSEGVIPDAFTFALLLKACGMSQVAYMGCKLHVQVARNGLLENNVVVGTALVDMYAKCGMLSKAQEVFDMLQVRTVVTWTALIAGYTQCEHCEEAFVCFKKMQSEGVFPNAITFSCGLKACAIVGAIDKGAKIHVEVARNGMLKTDLCLGNMLVFMYAKAGMLAEAREVFDGLSIQNIVTWTALMSGYIYHECGAEAIDCFENLQQEGISPDTTLFSCGLKACGVMGAIHRGCEIHAESARKGFHKTELCFGSELVDMYAKCGNLVAAEEVFGILLVRGAFVWNVLMSGYAQQGLYESVLGCCQQMLGDGRELGLVTFVSILTACKNGGMVDQGQRHFKAMSESYNMIPTKKHYTCMVDLLGRVGQTDRAIIIMEEMPLQPNVIMWRTFLDAYENLGGAEPWELPSEESTFPKCFTSSNKETSPACNKCMKTPPYS